MQEEASRAEAKRGALKKWRPKKWRPKYERIVAMSACGWSNKMIALETGYTPVHISNILNLEQAEEFRQQLLERMRQKALVSIPDTLDYIAQKTVQRLKEVIDDDNRFETSPFAVIDRGMDVLKGLGHLKGGGNGAPVGQTINVGTMVVSSTQADNLAEALRKADEVRKLHEVVVQPLPASK